MTVFFIISCLVDLVLIVLFLIPLTVNDILTGAALHFSPKAFFLQYPFHAW